MFKIMQTIYRAPIDVGARPKIFQNAAFPLVPLFGMSANLTATLLAFMLGVGSAVANAAPTESSPKATVECNADTDEFCVEGDKDKAARLNRQALEFSTNKDYDHALDLFKEAINLNKSNPEYHYNLGLTYYYKGMLKEEEASYLKVLTIEPNDRVLNPVLARTYFSLACVYAGQGKKDKAFEQLEKLFTVDSNMLFRSIHDGDLDSLREDPRYEQLLAKKPSDSSESGEAIIFDPHGKVE